MNPKTLVIQFFPVVAFPVSCRPAETKPADKHREGSRSSLSETCRLTANVGRSTWQVPGNARAPGQAKCKRECGGQQGPMSHTIENENKWEETITCLG
jgi:hypothetical protein